MTPLVSAEPLNFPLNFTWTAKATAKAGAALLTQGEYDATELRRYEEHQKCHGCGTREKAKKLVVVRDRITQETFEIGLECMRDLYGVNVETLAQHASEVAKTRRSLAMKLGLTGDLSTEQQIEIVREAVKTYIPVPERYLVDLDNLDVWKLQRVEEDHLRDLHQLACYHREWNESSEFAQCRWKALRGHPAFLQAHHQDVQERCARALASTVYMPDAEVFILNRYLRQAAAYKNKWARLVAPEDHISMESYEDAVRTAVQDRCALGQPVDHMLSGDRGSTQFKPETVVGLDSRALYATAGVWQDEADTFKGRLHDTATYWKKVRKPIIAVGPADVHEVLAVKGTRFNEKEEEWEEYEREPAFTFRFRRVAWALLEPYTDTYAFWRLYGRDRLERYK